MGNDETTFNMHQNTVKKLEFDLILIGGDIAYDNNIPQCYNAFEYFLATLPYLKNNEETNITRIIPFIFAVGNHDLGVDPYTGIELDHNKYEPILKHWFPQNTNNGSLPSIQQRKTYFSHEFLGNLLVLSLDTGYISEMEGEQKEWMVDILENSKAKIKIVQFHSPILPSFQQENSRDLHVEKIGQKHWLPIFDKYNITIVSESHSHTFMRSKKLKNMKENPNGTLYIGKILSFKQIYR